jgi:hypothetical protein
LGGVRQPRSSPLTRIQEVIDREDLTSVQKREIAESLSVAGSYEVDVQEEIVVEKWRFGFLSVSPKRTFHFHHAVRRLKLIA